MVEHSRLFFALWPSQGCRAALEAAVAPLLSQASGRQVPAQNYHLTSRTGPGRAIYSVLQRRYPAGQ